MSQTRKQAAEETQEEILEAAAQAFCALTRKSFSWFQAIAAEHGLSALQAKILLLIEPGRPYPMREVSELASCEPSHITSVVDKLEIRRLVRRSALKGDRRVKQVLLTNSGAAMRDKLFAGLKQPAPWMRSLSAGDQRRLRDILVKGAAFDELA